MIVKNCHMQSLLRKVMYKEWQANMYPKHICLGTLCLVLEPTVDVPHAIDCQLIASGPEVPMLVHCCYMLRYTLMLPDDCQWAGGPYAGTLQLYAQVYSYVVAR